MEVKKLLIVDDDPNIFELLRVNFESIGYQILHAADGAEAIAVTNKTPPDLIILDIMIPRIDGYEVCRRLRENDSTSFIPIIVLSAKDQPADKILGLKLGADDYLTKPFNIDELIARVETRLSRTEHYLAANPLTGLPGNVSIMHEVNRRLHASLSFAFLYCDIRCHPVPRGYFAEVFRAE